MMMKINPCLFFLITCTCVLHLIICGNSSQYYDQTPCFSNTNNPGTRYTCSSNSSRNPCRTFFVYRANLHFNTISTISNLFTFDPKVLLSINKHVSFPTQLLETGHEVLVPILCSCVGNFTQANFTYRVSEDSSTLSSIACDVFEGLVKYVTLYEENVNFSFSSSVLEVPLKCACPSDDDGKSGVKYLVTYPLIGGDDTRKVSGKFNVSNEEIWEANHMDPIPIPTIYPNTSILVPLKTEPLLNLDIQYSDPPTPQFLPTNTIEVKKNTRSISRLMKIYIVGSVIGLSLVVALLVACGLYIKALKKINNQNIRSVTPQSSSLSTNSCLSPDLIAGLKYSICMYSVEELKNGTNNFASKIADGVYKGTIDGSDVMIKRTRFEETKKLIDIHSKINHSNIVKLDGVCYDFSWTYLVYEHPLNGSLRECLSTSNYALNWLKRTQIAFDIATGLHYLHYSFIPPYTHHSGVTINAENIFLTSDWRAKIAVFGNSTGPVSRKDDIFSLGVVLLELVSGKGDVDGRLLREYSFGILGGEGGGGNEQGGCFDQLRKFVDPCLKDDYQIADALCLVVLGGSCVDENPLHRPSIDDVLKILARMV